MALAVVIVSVVRHPPPPLKLPRPTSAQLSTVLAWLIIAGIIVMGLLMRRK